MIVYLRDYKKECFCAPLFKLLEVCFELTVPQIMASIIDVGIANADRAYILKLGILLVLMGLLGLVSAVTAQYFSAKAAYGFGTELRRDLFAHINRFSYAEIDRMGTAGLITRMTGDINQTQTGVNVFLRLFMRSPFVVIGAVLMAFRINAKIARIFAVAVPLFALTLYLVMAFGSPLYRKAQKQLDVLSRITRENLSGVRVIRAFSRQEEEEKAFCATSREVKRHQLSAGRISSLQNPVTYVLVNLAIVLVIWQGSIQVRLGSLSGGEVIALVNYMNQILLALVVLAQLIVTLTRAMASASRLSEVLEAEPSMKEGTMRPTPVEGVPKIELCGVSFSYDGAGESALENISIRIQSGETVGIIGGTGSGKSTLVNLLPRFYDATEGTVRIDGVDVREYSFAALREKFGIVPQKAVLFRGSIRENLRWRKKNATDTELQKALEVAQASEIVKDRAGGLDASVAQGGRNFSGGQKQRLTIARALVGDPEILILDDSASALDYGTEARLRRALVENAKDMTVLLVTQRAASIRHANRILVLDDGKLVASGSHDELLQNCEIYREICASQLSEQEVKRA